MAFIYKSEQQVYIINGTVSFTNQISNFVSEQQTHWILKTAFLFLSVIGCPTSKTFPRVDLQ